MKQTSTQKIWTAGTNTLVVTVPKSVLEVQNIEAGDYLEITFEKLKNDTTEILKKELLKTQLKDNTKKSKIHIS